MRNLRLRRCVALLCLAVLLLGMVPTALAYGDASSWFVQELDQMENLGLIPPELSQKESLKGDCTRLEMCSLAVLAYETCTGVQIEVTVEKPFSDTDSPIAAKAYAAGLVDGYGDGKFIPDGLLTRQEFFAFVCKFLLATGFQPQAGHLADLSRFQDAAQVSPWALEQTRLVVGIGVVRGSGKQLAPNSSTTCEQALAMFCRAYLFLTEQQSNNPAEPEPSAPGTFEEKYPHMDAWASEELRSMDQAGLIPSLLIGQEMNASITRREMCYIAVAAFSNLYEACESDPMASPFTDVNDPIITQAYYLGIVNGFPDKTFLPDSLITREQIFTMTVNFLSAAGYYRTDAPEARLDGFSDSGTVQSYALPSTRLLVDMGIVQGDGNRLSPKANAQRQQALALFYRSFCYLTQWMDSEGEGDRPTDTTMAQELVAFALQYVGYNYCWGGEDPETGFDCSGLVYYVYRLFDFPVGRTATQQWHYENGEDIAPENLLPGDLVFFSPSGSEDDITHVGIYIGDDQFLHAANSARGVVVDPIDGYYFTNNFLGAKRIIP